MKLNKMLLAVAVAAALSACTVVAPNPDEVAVLVDRPLFFGDGGVRDGDIRTGGTRTYTWWTTEVRNITVKPVAVDVKFSDFNTKDNAPLDFNSVLRYRATDAAAYQRLSLY